MKYVLQTHDGADIHGQMPESYGAELVGGELGAPLFIRAEVKHGLPAGLTIFHTDHPAPTKS